MTGRTPRIQSWTAFKQDLVATAKGGKAPDAAGGPVVESVDVLMRLLTPENRELLRIIRDEKPESVASLARRTGRAEPNLARTLGKLEAVGLVEFRRDAGRRAPVTRAGVFRVEVDPFSQNDRIEMSGAGGWGGAAFAGASESPEDGGYDEG
ncbi:helix-turn-helix domain-containing protein [Phenylobacterium sp.]|uniref:HVO_A0114 family putative DNA-binding protein n=1 Tax=Phenylobacterium sp. TaxID=1871053 RepID=UPI0025F6B225|nr:helix-turn-helix domain-containing protein [Phenylobacterium sp.]